jgi:hypothetical protein
MLLEDNHHHHMDILYCFEIPSQLTCLTYFCHFLHSTAYDLLHAKMIFCKFSPLHSCKSLILMTKTVHKQVHFTPISHNTGINYILPQNNSHYTMYGKRFKKDTIRRQLDRHTKSDATVTWIFNRKTKSVVFKFPS